ncbi:MAG TPA: CheR family methyltransferase [Hanamia sp.]|nr:CheR family methyltransferase [Hanamia sp.]
MKKSTSVTRSPDSKKKSDSHPRIKPFPIVGIGASAGGIEAITLLMQNLAANNGMAYVIIQHLSPSYESILPEILERKTKMPVHSVINGIEIEPDSVYVIPPDTNMQILDGHLTLSQREKESVYHPIDEFLTSLATTYQSKAVGIILSGTATDGTLGLKSIKEEGGITFAQDSSAKFSGMPQSAIDSGQVDFILPPDKIGQELLSIIKSPYISQPEEILKDKESELNEVFNILHTKRNIDFSAYKQTTIYRRILRRIALHKLKRIEDYISLLKTNDAEISLLYNDLLINVTSFFRDPNVFAALSKKIFPSLIKNRKLHDPIRIWIPACSTGEEAYSVAISLLEYLNKRPPVIPFQVFATDINEWAIDKARTGLYHKNNLQNISAQRLKNFFTKIDGHYQVIKSLRDVCVFATHNILTDPPFSRIDLVSCQNVMIYFTPNTQQKALQAFHYSLKPTGFLLLGKSESTGENSELFEPVEGSGKIFIKKDGMPHIPFHFSNNSHGPFIAASYKNELENLSKSRETDVEKENDKILLSRYVPPSVLVNKDLHIIRFNGNMTDYLHPSAGKASLFLLKMIKDDFLIDVKTIISTAKKEGQTIRKKDVQFKRNGIKYSITIEVVPIQSSAREPYYLVLFKDEKMDDAEEKATSNKKKQRGNEEKLIRFERELNEAREQIKSISQEFEAAREELQSSNEEVLSSNEELQSINEELETSSEELRSTNEELMTINEELNHKNEDLKEAYKYREAIVETIREPLVVLNTDMRVLTANKAFYDVFETSPDETEGHNFYTMAKRQWNIPSLKKQLGELISKKESFKNFEIKHSFDEPHERTLLFNAMRMGDDAVKRNKILLVIEDVSERRSQEQALVKSHEQNLQILNSITDIFISVDARWYFTFINKSAENFIGKKAKDVFGKNIWEVMPAYVGTEFYLQMIQVMKTKEFAEFEFYDEHTKQWYSYHLYPAKDTLTIYANNITERKLSIELTNQSRERYQTFISKSTEGIWRFEVEKPISVKFSKEVQKKQLLKNAYLAECNNAIAKRYGYAKAEDIIGSSMGELLSDSQLKNYLGQFISSGYYLTDAVVHETVNGESKYYLNNLVGIVESDTIKRIWGTKRDITEQKRNELSLKRTQQKLALALSAAAVAAWIWHVDSNQIEWNEEQQKIYGTVECPDHCTFEDWIKIIHAEDAVEVHRKISDAVNHKKELSLEFRVLWPDESIHWILLKGNPSYDENGIVVQLAGVNIDITDRKLLEKEREDFIAITSHELKTPLTSIKAYSEILYEILEQKKDMQSASLAKKMDKQIDRLHLLIKDLLDVSKINEGQLQLKPSYFDFNKLLDNVIEDMQSTTQKHKLIKEAKVDQQIWADKEKIREVLINLISNAIKYSPNSSEIIIKANTDKRQLITSVKDFGIGISKTNILRLFNRFVRVNDSTVNTFPGLGLGLYISSEIIKKHNGTVWVESVKDQGSEFFFTLPLVTT